jgi:hypothetical protein
MTAIVLFTLSAAFVVYVLFGYPFVLWVLTRRARTDRSKAIDASYGVGSLTGKEWRAMDSGKTQIAPGADLPPELVDILVLSDGSTDGTAEIVKSFAADRVRLMELPPGGKASALTAGLAVARGDILFFTDVRQRLEPDSLTHLVDCLADPTIGVVSGELVILEGDSLEEASTGLYWKYEKWIRTRLSQIDSIYGATGCIYAMRRELAVPIPTGVLLDDVYQPLAAFFRGYRVILDTDAKAYDAPTSLHSEFRRKVRTLAGVYQVLLALPGVARPQEPHADALLVAQARQTCVAVGHADCAGNEFLGTRHCGKDSADGTNSVLPGSLTGLLRSRTHSAK